MSEHEHVYDRVPKLAGSWIACVKCGDPYRGPRFVSLINQNIALEQELLAKLSKMDECLRQIAILATRKNRGSTLAKDLLLDLNKIAVLAGGDDEPPPHVGDEDPLGGKE